MQWPCYDESHPGEMFLHGRLWSDPLIGPRAPFSVVEFVPPVDALDSNIPSASPPAAGSMITIPACKPGNIHRRSGARRRWMFLPKMACTTSCAKANESA